MFHIPGVSPVYQDYPYCGICLTYESVVQFNDSKRHYCQDCMVKHEADLLKENINDFFRVFSLSRNNIIRHKICKYCLDYNCKKKLCKSKIICSKSNHPIPCDKLSNKALEKAELIIKEKAHQYYLIKKKKNPSPFIKKTPEEIRENKKKYLRNYYKKNKAKIKNTMIKNLIFKDNNG